jgi:uncharacterized membrane protein
VTENGCSQPDQEIASTADWCPAMARTYGAERDTSRLMSFTDGVFAIALTLLITEIKPPGSPEGPEVGANLLDAMAGQWREYLALLLGFAVIGAYWLQHYYSGGIYTKTDHVFGVLNLLFMLAIVIVPYPLRVWSFNLDTPEERTASVTLAVGVTLLAVTWMGKWLYALPHRRIMDDRLTDDFIGQITRRYGVAALVQLAGIAIAFVAPRVGVAIVLATVFFFLIPQPKPRYKPGEEPRSTDASERS